MINELIDRLETLRINLDAEAWYDPTGEITRRCQRANEMLDDCIDVVKNGLSDEAYKLILED